MITDQHSNFLYLADSLPVKHPTFATALGKALVGKNISYAFIPGTKDIWARDYMPIQIDEERFVQFVYNPDYLNKSPKWKKSISDTDNICQIMGLKTIKSKIVLDGGNLVRGNNKVIMCTKVFKENPTYSEKELRESLECLLEVEQIVFIPQDSNDEIGHADGMVRFLTDEMVLLNDYSKEGADFQLNVRSALLNAGLDYIEVPFNPYQNRTDLDATGIYINYLKMDRAVFLPIYGMAEDETVIKLFEELFKEENIIPIHCNEIAKGGGVLNCISWNIHKSKTA